MEESNTLEKSFNSIESSSQEVPNIIPKTSEQVQRRSVCLSEISITSGTGVRRSRVSSDRLHDVNHIERIVRSGESGADSDEEFFDCKEVPEDLRSLTKWNSMELVPDSENDFGKLTNDKTVHTYQ